MPTENQSSTTEYRVTPKIKIMKITWLRQLFLFIFGTCVARQQLVFPCRFCRNLLLCPFQQLTIIHVSDKVQDSSTMDNTDGRGKKQAKSERFIF